MGVYLLIQAIIYLSLLLLDGYVGTLLALIIGGICLSIWLISLAVEFIEPSRVPKSYYRLMISGWLAPLMSVFVFAYLRGGWDFLTEALNRVW